MRPNLALLFYGASAVLVLGLVIEWIPAAEPPKLPPARLPHLAPADQTAASKDTGDWAEAILARPLFTVGRKPSKTSHGVHTTSGVGMPRLSGIMITPTGKRAIFMPDGGKPMTLAEGASLDDNTIRQIRPDRVVLTGPKGVTVLMLTYDKQQRTSGVTTPAFPQPGFTPGFPQPGMPQPGFNPGLAAFQGQPAPPPGENNNAGDDANDGGIQVHPPMPPPFPGFRGPNIPRGRE